MLKLIGGVFLMVIGVEVIAFAEEIPAFSKNPTGLETRLLMRVLTGPK